MTELTRSVDKSYIKVIFIVKFNLKNNADMGVC